MLQRILGADVSFVFSPQQPLGRVRIDPGSIEQVIMNLVVNARDAMPTGGTLTLETANTLLDDEYAKTHYGVTPGRYVVLTVTDTGVGMDKATQTRVFEPFFTTKEAGRGTGLGLSTVFGIVQQGGGSVTLESERGKGASFKVYLPRVDAKIESGPKSCFSSRTTTRCGPFREGFSAGAVIRYWKHATPERRCCWRRRKLLARFTFFSRMS
jgi:two-component system cell cycle sensor histidine kinase/response regulator CckA